MALPLALLGSCGKIEEPADSVSSNASLGSSAAAPSAGPAQGLQSAEALFARGQEASMDGDSARAIALYRQALQKAPDMTLARFALGTALVPTAGASALGSGTKDPKVLAESIEHLRQVCEEAPEHADYTYWLGRVLDVAGHEQEAAGVLQRATELDPEHGKAFKRLGLVHNSLGNRDQALAAWIRAGELLPTDAGIFFNLGNLYFEDDLEQSNAYYKRSTEVDPYFPKGYLGLSKTLSQMGKPEEADEAKRLFGVFQTHDKKLKRLVFQASEAPEDEAAQFEAAEMYFALGQYDSSLAMFRRVLLLNPKNALAHLYAGEIFTKTGNLESALNHFEECVFHEPGIPSSLLALLATCVALENELRAAEVCDLLEPLVQTPEDHAKFAALLTQLGRDEQASKHVVIGEAPTE